MKKLFTLAARHKMTAAYALAALLWAAYALLFAGMDALGYASGRLHTVTLPLAELPMQDLALDANGQWVTTGGDPQLLLELDQPVRSVRLATEAPASGFEGYFGRAGQDASLRRRVWAQQQNGAVLLVFPQGSASVRIDPAGGAGVVLGGADTALTVNAPLPLWQYFIPRGEQPLALALLPAAAAALWDLAACWLVRLRR